MLTKGVFLVTFTFILKQFTTKAQIVNAPLSLDTTTGCKTAGSQVEVSVGLSGGSYTMYWKINTTTIASCLYPAKTCNPVSGSIFESRIKASYSSSKFYLHLNTTATDQTTTLYVLDALRLQLAKKSFTVETNCFICSSQVNCSTLTCGLDCKTQLVCVGNYTGNKTGVCQDDCSFAETGTCCKDCSLPTSIGCGCEQKCNVSSDKTSMHCGESIQVTCTGKCEAGTTEIQCDSKGNLTANLCNPIKCLVPDSISCGCQEDCSFATSGGDEVVLNTTISLACPQGCTGTAVTQCGEDGKFVVTQTCAYVECVRPESIPCRCESEECSFPEGDNVQFSQTVQLDCPVGCNGTATARCLADGNFETTDCPGGGGKEKSLSDAAIAGIVVGCLSGCCAIVVLFYCCCCRGKK